MLSISFVKPFQVFASDINTIEPICTTDKILSYKSSGYNGIGSNYYDLEPESVSISIDDTDIAPALAFADNYDIFDDIVSPPFTLTEYDWKRLRIWGCGVIIYLDGAVILNGWCKYDSISLDKESHIFQFKVFDIVGTNAIKNSYFTRQYSPTQEIQVIDLLTSMLTIDSVKFNPTVSIDTTTLQPDITILMGQTVNNEVLPLAIELEPTNFLKAHDTPPFARYIDPPAGWADPDPELVNANSYWFLGILELSHRHALNLPIVNELVMLALRIDNLRKKAIFCRWVIDKDNPLENVNIVPTQYVRANTEQGFLDTMLLYFPGWQSVILANMGQTSQTNYRYYISPTWGWELEAYIAIPNEYDGIMPMDYGNALFVNGVGQVPPFTKIRFADDSIRVSTEVVPALLQLNNWTLKKSTLTNQISVINKMLLSGNEATPINIQGSVISDNISGSTVSTLTNYKTDMFSGAANIKSVLNVHYEKLFARYRYKAEIVIDGFSDIQIGTKIVYRGYEYMVFGVNYDSNTTLLTCLGEFTWQ